MSFPLISYQRLNYHKASFSSCVTWFYSLFLNDIVYFLNDLTLMVIIDVYSEDQ